MKKTRLKIISIFLLFVLAIGIIPFVNYTYSNTSNPVEASAATTKMTLDELKAKFPQGKYWNHLTNTHHNNSGYGGTCTNNKCTNPDGWTNYPCSVHGGLVTAEGKYDCNYFDKATQCVGFAFKLANDAYGESAREWKFYENVKSLGDVKPGDIITYLKKTSDDAGHTVFVIGVSGDRVYFAECNYNGRCKINWTRSLLKSQFTNISKVRIAPYELNISSNKLTINYSANGGTVAPTNDYKLTEATNLRNAPSTSGTKVYFTIPKGKVITVTETKVAGGYTWGNTVYDGQQGWCVLKYTTRQGYYSNEDIIYNYANSQQVTTVWNKGAGVANGLYIATTFGLTKSGYKFKGWCKDLNGDSIIFDQDDTKLKAEDIEPTITQGNKSITLYAIWEPDCAQGNHIDVDGAWEYDNLSHYYTCSCGEKFNVVNHNGGTATCTEQKVCADCGVSYGDALGHDFTIEKNDETHHWLKCSRCDEVSYKEQHTGGVATCIDQKVCTDCGTSYGSVLGHDFIGSVIYAKYDNGHAKKCSRCNVYETVQSHNYGNDKVCDDCGYDKTVPHSHEYTLYVVSDVHKAKDATCEAKATYYKSCSCGLNGIETFEYGEKNMNNHTKNTFTFVDNANGTHTKANACCGTVVSAEEVHVFGDDNICDGCRYEHEVENSPETDGDNDNKDDTNSDKEVIPISIGCNINGGSGSLFNSGAAILFATICGGTILFIKRKKII